MVLKEIIQHDLETAPLFVKTANTGFMRVQFYSAGGEEAGLVAIKMPTPPTFRFGHCIYATSFPTTPPIKDETVWKITKLPGPRMKLHCNGVEVLDMLITVNTCTISSWGEHWSRDVKRVKFLSVDSSSKYYKIPPGNCNPALTS